MKVTIQFFSYFRDLTGCASTQLEIPTGTSVGELHALLMKQFPKLESMKRSTLIAVGVDYQPPEHQLKEGDEVSLFPPVQGG